MLIDKGCGDGWLGSVAVHVALAEQTSATATQGNEEDAGQQSRAASEEHPDWDGIDRPSELPRAGARVEVPGAGLRGVVEGTVRVSGTACAGLIVPSATRVDGAAEAVSEIRAESRAGAGGADPAVGVAGGRTPGVAVTAGSLVAVPTAVVVRGLEAAGAGVVGRTAVRGNPTPLAGPVVAVGGATRGSAGAAVIVWIPPALAAGGGNAGLASLPAELEAIWGDGCLCSDSRNEGDDRDEGEYVARHVL